MAWGDEHLYSAGMDGTVRAWDVRMGARSLFLCDPYGHEGRLEVVLRAAKVALGFQATNC